MHRNIYRWTTLLVIISFAIGNHTFVQAAPGFRTLALARIFYVSTTGNDSNPGTLESPFKTFTRAVSSLASGDTLNILPGVYNQILKIPQSGKPGAPILIQGTGAVIDLGNFRGPAVKVAGSYIQVTGLEVRKVDGICVGLFGNNVILSKLIVHECTSHGINTEYNAHIRILNSRVFRTVLQNRARNLTSGWASAIKVRVSTDVLIQGNVVYHNYGEGIATRGANITIRRNKVFDNFSVNIYAMSERTLIEKNFVYCTPDSGFERNGKPAGGIGLAEEYFSDLPARLTDARVYNNIVVYCNNGVRFYGSEAGIPDAGLKRSMIAFNTFYGSAESAIGVVYASAQAGNLIANNIIWQADNRLVYVENPTGIVFKNNLWKVYPPEFSRSPGDVVGSPKFLTQPPRFKATDYQPALSSIAAGAAIDLNILKDYFNNPRIAPYDIGAIQFSTRD
jgi:parallel beta-helix repeat protein